MNPFLQTWTDPIPFRSVNAEHVRAAAQQIMAKCLEIKAAILNSPADCKRGRLHQMDLLEGELDLVLSPIYLLNDVHPDDNIRNACHEALSQLLNFDSKMDYDEDLYASLFTFAETAPELSPVEARYLKQRLDNFERNGLKLPKAERDRLTVLDEKITEQELQFTRNISEGEVVLFFPESKLKGLPSEFLDTRRQDDGTVKITTQYPDYIPFMKNVVSESARKELYETYNTRCKETNLPVLRELLILRNERSSLLGFDSYASYQLQDKMAHNSETVKAFLNELGQKVGEKGRADYDILCHQTGSERLDAWSKQYANTQYKAAHFKLSEEQIKPYFPLEGTLKGVFELCETLFSVRFQKVSLPTWHESVTGYEVWEGEKLIGRFYLDMFPRKNKYNHAACFGLHSGRLSEEGYVHPLVALVCNFPSPTETKPSLLSHSDVETLFHEFGHLLHQILTTVPFTRQSGTSVARDFVEMPSQLMENWAWEKSVLKTFARHYETGELIPDELLDKMLAVRQLSSGLDVQQQLLYSSLDLRYHDGFQPGEDVEETTRIYKELCEEHTLFPSLEHSCMQATFGHLVNYAAGYYGYLWSNVYAIDMFSVFKEGGIISPEVGARFRDIILARGDSEEPMALIEAFLGRKPTIDAYLASIGV